MEIAVGWGRLQWQGHQPKPKPLSQPRYIHNRLLKAGIKSKTFVWGFCDWSGAISWGDGGQCPLVWKHPNYGLDGGHTQVSIKVLSQWAEAVMNTNSMLGVIKKSIENKMPNIIMPFYKWLCIIWCPKYISGHYNKKGYSRIAKFHRCRREEPKLSVVWESITGKADNIEVSLV